LQPLCLGRKPKARVATIGRKNLKKKMKVESTISLYVHALFINPPKIIFDRKIPLTCKQFVDAYGLCSIKPFPKNLKLGLDYTKEEVLELLDLLLTKMAITIIQTTIQS
jgi:hypothetical protein